MRQFKKVKSLAFAFALAAGASVADNIAPKMTAFNENPSPENVAARRLFAERGFGLFIHYGLYSVSGYNEWQLFQDSLDAEKYYAERVPFFKPKPNCVEEWIRLAKDTGMRYIVLTTRHHEGFWLGDDLIREYTTKVREAGLGVGVYFSVADWSDPGYRAGSAKDPEGWRKFVEKAHAQLRHLMTDFGKIEYLFYDGCPPPAEWDLMKINGEMRRLQPQLLICRGHKDCDFKSCEGHMGGDATHLWESCYTFNHSWGYNKLDLDFKSPEEAAHMLFYIRHCGGNFLLNVGPMADGTVQPEAAERLRELGKWVKKHEEAVFGIVPHPFDYACRELMTGSGKDPSVVYHLTEDARIRDGKVIIGISNTVKRVTYLDDGSTVPFRQDNSGATPRLVLEKVSKRTAEGMPRIFKIELDGAPQGIFNERLPKYAGNRRAFTDAKIAAKHRIVRKDEFHGFERTVFDFRGHQAWVVYPKDVPVKGNPWTWTMQWATAFVPRTNVPKLLENGYHHVTLECFAEKMDPEGIALCAEFQKFLVEELGFAPKANLIGMSWGGFFSCRYAGAHPENVRKIYLDAPLLNFAKYAGAEGNAFWEGRRPADAADWTRDPEMPLNQAEKIAKAGIPVLLLYGGADNVVDPKVNCEPFIEKFRAAGGDIKAVKRGLYAHHPHGIEVDETLIKDFFEADAVPPLAQWPGAADARNGWNYIAEEEGKMVYVPFEGVYPSKGGRIESPWFRLQEPTDENRYLRFTFSSKSAVDGYWWVDYKDKDGRLMSDVNSRLYASEDWKSNDIIVPVHPGAVEAQIALITRKGAYAKDVTVRAATLDETLAWCSALYQSLPKKLDYAVGGEAWDRLPKSRTKIQVGKEFTIVLLGDSIINDSYCGHLTAQAQKWFPDTKLKVICSVRGSTGCWYYHEKEHFDEYVAKYNPDLVVIGGISNYTGPKQHTLKEAEDNMVETIQRCQALGAEVVVCTPPPSYEFRKDAAAKPFDRALLEESVEFNCLQQAYEYRAAARTGVQVWDLTTGPCEAISRSGKPLDWFKRDAAHNDDRGKQLIAQMYGEYFRAAILSR